MEELQHIISLLQTASSMPSDVKDALPAEPSLPDIDPKELAERLRDESQRILKQIVDISEQMIKDIRDWANAKK